MLNLRDFHVADQEQTISYETLLKGIRAMGARLFLAVVEMSAVEFFRMYGRIINDTGRCRTA